MDRQEAIQTLSKVGKISVSYAEDLYDSFFPKPVVPQYVADWYEEHKWDFEGELGCRIAIIAKKHGNEEFSDFEKWLNDNEQSLTTLVNMHQFGYEVDKETRYTVRVKGIDGYCKYLNQDMRTRKRLFASETELERFRAHHTRKELEEADFEWVFNCPGVEVKEVDDGND